MEKRQRLSPKNVWLIHCLTNSKPTATTQRDTKLRHTATSISCWESLSQSYSQLHIYNDNKSQLPTIDSLQQTVLYEAKPRPERCKTACALMINHFLFLIFTSILGSLCAWLLSLLACFSKYRGTVKLARKYCKAKRLWIDVKTVMLVTWVSIVTTSGPLTSFVRLLRPRS